MSLLCARRQFPTWTLALFVLAAGAPALGQQADQIRYAEDFDPAGMDASMTIRIERIDDDDRSDLRVRLVDERRGSQLAEEVPDWLADPHYGFEILSEEIGDRQTAVVLEARPGVHGDGPPSAPQYQVAWTVTPRPGGYDWKRLETARYSKLDGGERFEFRGGGEARRLVRLRNDEDSLFCGASEGDPVLFDEYDPQRGEFERAIDFDSLLEDAPTVRPTADDDFRPPRIDAWYQWFAATSDHRAPGRRGTVNRPMELGDGRADAAWMEGVDGLGRGEFASAQVNDIASLTSFHVIPGFPSSEDAYRAHGRPTRLLIGLSDGSRYVVELGEVDFERASSGRGLYVELPEPRRTRCLSVMLLEAESGEQVDGQPGGASSNVAIAELLPYSEIHGEDAHSTARRLVERISTEDEVRVRERLAEFAFSLDEALVDEVLRALDRGSGDERRRIIPLLGSLPPDEAVPVLVDFLQTTDTDAPEYRALKRSLAAHYANAAPALVEYLKESKIEDDERKYTDILRLLGRVGEPEHLEELIEQLGRGERSVRNERVRAVGAGGRNLVEPLLEHARWHVNTDAGYDALRTLNLIGKRLYYQEQGELPRADLYEALLEESTDRRALMRAIRVARFFHSEEFVDTVEARFVDHGDALVRREAVDALERYDSSEARRILADRLEDRSPDVRIAAVSSLSKREDVEQSLPALLDYAESERWKPGLRRAFRALADIDDERVDRAFEDLFRERPNDEQALWAASALARAGRSVDDELVRHIIGDEDVDLEMRIEMIDLLGLDDSSAGEAFLLDMLEERAWRNFDRSRRAQEKVRDRVLLSLGRRRSERAQTRLLDLAQNADDAGIQRAALRSLGFYRDEDLLETLEHWREDAPPELRGVLDQTTSMIRRRLDIEGVQEDIDTILEEEEVDAPLDGESESRPPDDTSQ